MSFTHLHTPGAPTGASHASHMHKLDDTYQSRKRRRRARRSSVSTHYLLSCASLTDTPTGPPLRGRRSIVQVIRTALSFSLKSKSLSPSLPHSLTPCSAKSHSLTTITGPPFLRGRRHLPFVGPGAGRLPFVRPAGARKRSASGARANGLMGGGGTSRSHPSHLSTHRCIVHMLTPSLPQGRLQDRCHRVMAKQWLECERKSIVVISSPTASTHRRTC